MFNHGYVQGYDSALGQVVLVVVVGLYGAGFVWMRKLATFRRADGCWSAPEPRTPGRRSREAAGRVAGGAA